MLILFHVRILFSFVPKFMYSLRTAILHQFTQGQVLAGHSGSVTCAAAINYFPDGEDPVINTLIASGSADSTVCIWKRSDPKGAVVVQERENTVCSHLFTVMKILLLVHLLLYSCTHTVGQFELLQTIPFGRGFVMGLDFHELPGVKGQPLLACGGDDSKVHLFTSQQDRQVM